MNKKLGFIVLALGLLLTGCTASPNAGHEAVLVKKPLIFGHGGIDPTPVTTGMSFIAPTTTAIDVNMQPQQMMLDMSNIMTSDGVPLDFEAALRLRVMDSVKLIKYFGPNWYQNNIEKEFFKDVRQEVRHHGMNETAINSTAIDTIDTNVAKALTTYLQQKGIPVELLQVTVGKATPPDAIKTQRINTAAEQQRILTEQQRKLAEDARLAAETSRANADNAYRDSMHFTQDQYLRLQVIRMQEDVCAHNSSHCTFVINGTSVQPILNVK